MVVKQSDLIHLQQGNLFTQLALNPACHAFNNHPDLTLMVDILSRQKNNHIVFTNDLSSNIRQYFFQALLLHLTLENIPSTVRFASVMQLEQAIIFASEDEIQQECKLISDHIETSNHCIILLVPTDILQNTLFTGKLLQFIKNPKCRCLILGDFAQPIFNNLNRLSFSGMRDEDTLKLLKYECKQLERYHNVSIPENCATQAYNLAERYLGIEHVLDNTLKFLDSCAARLSCQNHDNKILTITLMAEILSSWIKIPIQLLQKNTFNLVQFTQSLQAKIFGQDASLMLLGHQMQQAHSNLHTHAGPFASFLLVGQNHCGKTTTIVNLVEQLFKQFDVLYFAQELENIETIANIKFQRFSDKQFNDIATIAQHTPHAVIVFENIEIATHLLFDEWLEILATGKLQIHDKKLYFGQMIFCFTTTAGSKRLIDNIQTFNPDAEEINQSDLLQVVMNNKNVNLLEDSTNYSGQELVELIIPDLNNIFTERFLKQLSIVPFLPLGRQSIEKIIQYKLETLRQLIHQQYQLEFRFAKEILPYLVREVVLRHELEGIMNIDKILKNLYFCVEQAIFRNTNTDSKTLFLQLNETGQALRCDWK